MTLGEWAEKVVWTSVQRGMSSRASPQKPEAETGTSRKLRARISNADVSRRGCGGKRSWPRKLLRGVNGSYIPLLLPFSRSAPIQSARNGFVVARVIISSAFPPLHHLVSTLTLAAIRLSCFRIPFPLLTNCI